MSPRPFYKQRYTPYFQSAHYLNESNASKMEKKIEAFIITVFYILTLIPRKIFRFRVRRHK